MKPRSRLSGRLYFFPAFLPLIELVPWLLTVIAALAGMAGFSRLKYKKYILVLASLCFVTAGGALIHAMPDKEIVDNGTRLLAPDKFPVAEFYDQAAEFVPRQAISFGEIWTRPLKKQVLSTPVVAGNLLVFGSFENSVEALSLQTGKAVWSLPQDAPVFSLTGDTEGVIYVGEGLHHTQAAFLSAIEARTGAVLWRREFLGHIEEAVTLSADKNRLWLGTGPGGVWSLDARDARVVWHRALGHIDSEPLVHDGVLYVPAQADESRQETKFFALNARNGKTLWQLDQPGQPWGSPVFDGPTKTILTSTGLGQIGVSKSTDKGWAQAVTTDGKLRWQTDLPGMPLQPPAHIPEDGIIIHTIKNGEIFALNTADGSIVWKTRVGADTQAPATLVTGFGVPMLAVTTYEGILSIHNALTGDVLARRNVGKFSTSSPVVSGDALYVAGAHVITAFGGLHSLTETK